jgi:hypothetical protein
VRAAKRDWRREECENDMKTLWTNGCEMAAQAHQIQRTVRRPNYRPGARFSGTGPANAGALRVREFASSLPEDLQKGTSLARAAYYCDA